jgi:hypothetical protein
MLVSAVLVSRVNLKIVEINFFSQSVQADFTLVVAVSTAH